MTSPRPSPPPRWSAGGGYGIVHVKTVFSEDLGHGQTYDTVTVTNPFV